MNDLVFVLVVASRFVAPLFIPRFALPAITVALVIDAADQTVFAAFDVEPENYQAYDKALDIFYLAIAYTSTIRNWTDGVAFRVAQCLWYYRLLGVVVFELTEARALLLIFPNTFEYFFIAYEIVRLKWNPRRLSTRAVISLAAAIWIFVKLPQEWWIHIAQLDVTDEIGLHPWIVPAAVLALLAGVVALYRERRRFPEPDWPATVDVDAHPTTVIDGHADPSDHRWALINAPILEKTLLVGLVTAIFVQLVPDVDASTFGVIAAVGVIITANAIVGRYLVRRGTTWASTTTQFVTMALVNLGIVAVLSVLLGRSRDGDDGVELGLSLFLLGLITLIATLYDRYRSMRMASQLPNPTTTHEGLPS